MSLKCHYHRLYVIPSAPYRKKPILATSQEPGIAAGSHPPVPCSSPLGSDFGKVNITQSPFSAAVTWRHCRLARGDHPSFHAPTSTCLHLFAAGQAAPPWAVISCFLRKDFSLPLNKTRNYFLLHLMRNTQLFGTNNMVFDWFYGWKELKNYISFHFCHFYY